MVGDGVDGEWDDGEGDGSLDDGLGDGLVEGWDCCEGMGSKWTTARLRPSRLLFAALFSLRYLFAYKVR